MTLEEIKKIPSSKYKFHHSIILADGTVKKSCYVYTEGKNQILITERGEAYLNGKLKGSVH